MASITVCRVRLSRVLKTLSKSAIVAFWGISSVRNVGRVVGIISAAFAREPAVIREVHGFPPLL
jgi:hypothetical protein